MIFGEQEVEQPQEEALPARPGWLNKLRAAEQQPEEMPVRQALPAIAKQARGLGWRTFSAFWLCLALVYLTFASKAGWPLPPMLSYITAPYIYLLAVSLGQLGVMLLGADVMAKGARDIIGLRPGLESLVTVSGAAAIAYVMGVIIRPELGGYLPYCVVAAFSVWLCMLGSYLRLSALRWSCRLAVSAEQPYTVVREEAVWELRSAYVKSVPDDTGGFIAQSRLPDCVERFMRFFAPLAIIASFVFALLASRNESVRFLWALSAVISPAAGSFALCAALPYFMAAKKLFPVGAALAGWKAASELSDDSVMVLTDGDLFPPGTVTLSGLKVFNNYPTEMVIACAASLMEASGSGLTRIFGELVHNRSDVLRKAEQFQYYEGGGMGCEIAGNAVLMGTQNFMLRMGVRLPEGVSLRDAVYLSLNHDLAGVFAVGYTSSAGVRDGFAALMSRKVTLIIAARDFNITPAMLREKMSANIDYAEFPVIEERLDLSRQDRWVASPPAAVIVREGLAPFAESVMTARRFHRIALVNLVLSVIGAAAGILIMYYLAYTGSFSAAAPGNLFLYSALWTVPAVMLSGWVGAG